MGQSFTKRPGGRLKRRCVYNKDGYNRISGSNIGVGIKQLTGKGEKKPLPLYRNNLNKIKKTKLKYTKLLEKTESKNLRRLPE